MTQSELEAKLTAAKREELDTVRSIDSQNQILEINRILVSSLNGDSNLGLVYIIPEERARLEDWLKDNPNATLDEVQTRLTTARQALLTQDARGTSEQTAIIPTIEFNLPAGKQGESLRRQLQELGVTSKQNRNVIEISADANKLSNLSRSETSTLVLELVRQAVQHPDNSILMNPVEPGTYISRDNIRLDYRKFTDVLLGKLLVDRPSRKQEQDPILELTQGLVDDYENWQKEQQSP